MNWTSPKIFLPLPQVATIFELGLHRIRRWEARGVIVLEHSPGGGWIAVDPEVCAKLCVASALAKAGLKGRRIGRVWAMLGRAFQDHLANEFHPFLWVSSVECRILMVDPRDQDHVSRIALPAGVQILDLLRIAGKYREVLERVHARLQERRGREATAEAVEVLSGIGTTVPKWDRRNQKCFLPEEIIDRICPDAEAALERVTADIEARAKNLEAPRE